MTNKLFVKGFSLIELLIVIMIVGIVTMLAIPSYNRYILKAKMVEFFTLADLYKLELLEKMLHDQFLDPDHFNSVIENPSELVTKLEFLKNPTEHSYSFKLTANMVKLGITMVNNMPLELEFIAQQDPSNKHTTWRCQYNVGYADLVPKICVQQS